jgi:hypothetical protein
METSIAPIRITLEFKFPQPENGFHNNRKAVFAKIILKN